MDMKKILNPILKIAFLKEEMDKNCDRLFIRNHTARTEWKLQHLNIELKTNNPPPNNPTNLKFFIYLNYF